MAINAQALNFAAGVAVTAGINFITAAPLGTEIAVPKLVLLSAPWFVTAVALVRVANVLDEVEGRARDIISAGLTETEQREVRSTLRRRERKRVAGGLLVAGCMAVIGIAVALVLTLSHNHSPSKTPPSPGSSHGTVAPASK